MERVHKYLAGAGVASRRKCEQLVASGRVTVNGVVVADLRRLVDPERDSVAVDGRTIHPVAAHTYIALHKPRGYVSTVTDTHGRPTVLDLVRAVEGRIYPVGRLDMDSEGLLLLTNDGEMAFGLTHPSREVPKTYVVTAKKPISPRDLEILRKGVELEDGVTLPARADLVDESGRVVRMVLREGRKREIRRMFETLGNSVERLIRVKFGPISLGKLAPGQYRRLTRSEVEELRNLTMYGKGSSHR
ncbi:MAG: rRNA pseudouridine synthase [Firmicutes bacterium]|nr:rRNA pseudouridine synthase [Bacillota bacterium]